MLALRSSFPHSAFETPHSYLPPLRERKEDIPELVAHFVALHAEGEPVR